MFIVDNADRVAISAPGDEDNAASRLEQSSAAAVKNESSGVAKLTIDSARTMLITREQKMSR